METSMLAYKRQFSAYEYLWTTDLQAMFAEFLEEASYDEAMEEDEDDPAGGYLFCFRSFWGGCLTAVATKREKTLYLLLITPPTEHGWQSTDTTLSRLLLW